MASIQKRITSKGEAYVVTYYDLSGRRRSKTIYGSHSDAEDWADELEKRRELRKVRTSADKFVHKPQKILLSKAIEDYLHSVSTHKAEATQKIEKWVFNTFQDNMDEMPVSYINLKMMETYVADRMEAGISPTSLGIEIRTLKAFFNHQIKYGVIDRNPTKGLRLPKPKKKKIRFLSQDEIDAFLGVIDDQDYHDLFVTYLNTGARHQELLPANFTWDDVDLRGRRLQLTGKGSSGYVPMNEVVHEILKRRKERGEEYPFKFDYSYLYKKFKFYMKEAKIEDVTLHDLRKTFGSLLIAQKVDIFRVSKLLRHSSVTVTESHYIDILDRDLEDTVKKLDELFIVKEKATS